MLFVKSPIPQPIVVPAEVEQQLAVQVVMKNMQVGLTKLLFPFKFISPFMYVYYAKVEEPNNFRS